MEAEIQDGESIYPSFQTWCEVTCHCGVGEMAKDAAYQAVKRNVREANGRKSQNNGGVMSGAQMYGFESGAWLKRHRKSCKAKVQMGKDKANATTVMDIWEPIKKNKGVHVPSKHLRQAACNESVNAIVHPGDACSPGGVMNFLRTAGYDFGTIGNGRTWKTGKPGTPQGVREPVKMANEDAYRMVAGDVLYAFWDLYDYEGSHEEENQLPTYKRDGKTVRRRKINSTKFVYNKDLGNLLYRDDRSGLLLVFPKTHATLITPKAFLTVPHGEKGSGMSAAPEGAYTQLSPFAGIAFDPVGDSTDDGIGGFLDSTEGFVTGDKVIGQIPQVGLVDMWGERTACVKREKRHPGAEGWEHNKDLVNVLPKDWPNADRDDPRVVKGLYHRYVHWGADQHAIYYKHDKDYNDNKVQMITKLCDIWLVEAKEVTTAREWEIDKKYDLKGRMYNRFHADRQPMPEVGEQTGGLNFGWSFPLSLLHWPPEGVHMVDKTNFTAPEKGEVVRQYQPWPRWRDNTSFLKFPYLPFGQSKNLPKLTDLLVFDDDSPEALPRVSRAKPQIVDETRDIATVEEAVPDAAQMAPEDVETMEEDHELETVEDPGPWLDNEDFVNLATAEKMANKPGKLGEATEEFATEFKEGSARPPNSESNVHFWKEGPWPVQDVYTRPELAFVLGKELSEKKDDTGKSEVDKYIDRYGNIANLYLRTSKPTALMSVNHEDFLTKSMPGMPRTDCNGKRFLDYYIDAGHNDAHCGDLTPVEREMFRTNFRRILSIFHDSSGEMQYTGWSPEEKRCYMRYGLCEGDIPRMVEKHGEGQGPLKGRRKRKGQTGCQSRTVCGKIVWDKVFETIAGDNVTERNKWTVKTELYRGDRTSAPKFADKFENEPIPTSYTSNMTVLEWLQTPWHYMYLPYRRKTSVFAEGETYCAGCTRCSRPFYEQQYWYAPFAVRRDGAHKYATPKPALHFPHMYWNTTDDLMRAPLPFHHGEFWKKKTVEELAKENYHKVGEQGSRAAEPSGTVGMQEGNDGKGRAAEERGFHAWPVSSFEMPTPEIQLRLHKSPLVKTGWNKGASLDAMIPMLYRRYINHMYDEEQTYDELIQGAIRTEGAKVKWGMRKYMLMRSVKYGNVCVDCRTTLTRVGLYERNGVVKDSRKTLPPTRKGEIKDVWWLMLPKELKVTYKGKEYGFSPWVIYAFASSAGRNDGKVNHLQSPYEAYKHIAGVIDHRRKPIDGEEPFFGPRARSTREDVDNKQGALAKLRVAFKGDFEAFYNAHIDAVVRYQQSKCSLDHERLSALDAMWKTRIKSHVDIYTQKWWDTQPRDWAKRDQEGITQSVSVVDRLICALDKQFACVDEDNKINRTALKVANRDVKEALDLLASSTNPKVNRALRDLLHDLRCTATQFGLMQTAEPAPRFNNELYRIETRNVKRTGSKEFHIKIEMPIEAPMQGPPGKTDTPGKWKTGVLQMQEDKYWPQVKDSVVNGVAGARPQLRKLTQTRVFITYSLHRRVWSNLEARHCLERMGDACRALFTNDEHLCKIIVFGYKLKRMGGASDQPDSVGALEWKIIDKSKKTDNVFYGFQKDANDAEVQDSSYCYDTYATHVHSVDVAGGMEIGPTYHHPHFHVLLTVAHFSYIHIDKYRLEAVLEQMFKGLGPFAAKGNDCYGPFELVDGSGRPFYTDNEKPYCKVELYPDDNVAERVLRYVKKGAVKDSIEAVQARHGLV